jgi:Rrf2 family cysteine metabolism transcriptional repressor
MRVSTRGRYGLRVLIELALRHGQGPTMMAVLAACTGVSRKYLYNLLTAMKAAGLVRAVRGAAGGFELARPPGDIRVDEVVRVLEDRATPAECVSDDAACGRIEGCAAREVWLELDRVTNQVLSGFRLSDLAERQRARCPPKSPA